jgi:hypothetical protein
MKGSRTDAVVLGLSALAPACFAAAHVRNVSDAAHDGGVMRVLGLDPQLWRAVDVAVGVAFAGAPIGTRAARAALGGALVAGIAGAVLYGLARELLRACAETRLGLFVAPIVAVTPLVAAPWQIESAAVGGSATGAVLVLLPIAVLAQACSARTGPPQAGSTASWSAGAMTLGLALGHEPLVGVCALAGCTALVASSPSARESTATALREKMPLLLASLFAGCSPFLMSLVRVRAAGVPLSMAFADAWSGERGTSLAGSPAHFVYAEVGVVLATLALIGSALAMLVGAARPLASALIAVSLSGFACAWLGAPLGPTRFGAPVLAAFAAVCVLAGVSMQAAVRAIAAARIPMSQTSAAMVVVLELALPVEMADEAVVRSTPRNAAAECAWNDAAWGALPGRTVVLVTTPQVFARAGAARAQSELRDDLTVVPTFLRGARERWSLAQDPALIPLWRDLELAGAPGEAALSSVAAVRPLAMSYESRWGRAIGKHLVPAVLFDRFEPEPRGASDRRRALDVFAASRDRLAREIEGDPELTAATVVLLRSRAELAAGMTGDPDLVSRTAADVRAFAEDR